MVSKTHDDEARGRGRPQAFDRETVLREAMKLFWERGYEGTSFDDLIAAMQISPSSFYNSFGGKERLYQEATDFYIALASEWFMGVLLRQGDTRKVFARLLKACAEQFTSKGRPPGCMISLAGTHLAPNLGSVRRMMAAHRANVEAALADRLTRGISAGDLPADCDAKSLATYYHALIRGMAVLARDGASRRRLARIGDVGMKAWPTPAPHRDAVAKTKAPPS